MIAGCLIAWLASPASPASAKSATRKARGPSRPAPAVSVPRQLQDIHIEGEIPVPQVLFITARDQRRFMDFQYRRYLRTSFEVGEQTNLPSRIVLIGNRPAGSRKETTP